MQTNVYNELLNKRELQHLQREFFQVTGVCGYCMDETMQRITEISGTEEQIQEISRILDSDRLTGVLERVEDGSLEDQAVEELDPEGNQVAAIAVRVGGTTVLYWMVFSYNFEKQIDSMEFMQILDLLRDSSGVLFRNRMSCFNAEAESQKSRSAEQEMSRNLHTIEATTQVVQLLDSDERVEAVLEKWLSIIKEYLGIETAQIYQIHADGETMDLLCQQNTPGCVSIFEQTSNLQIGPFLGTDKPLVISLEDATPENADVLLGLGLTACMVFPIIRNENKGGMVVSFNYRNRKHSWTVPEIKFTADAIKIMQSILTKRIQKNSIASSYQALEMILDNVGCAIYVSDKSTGKMLFANRRLQNTFAKELKEGSFDRLLAHGISTGNENGIYEIHHLERGRWYDLIFKEITWVDNNAVVLHSLYDITDKKLYQRKIEQQAYTDFLTGLYNRMCCERDLARQIDQAKKNNEIGALLYLDLDDFKHINDGLGHQYGDVLLKAISHSLQRIHGLESSCYRMGGDEFVIVISPEHYPDFDRIVEDIKDIFAKPWFLKDADYYCTMSMGIVTFPDLGDSVPDLIKKADIAMYEAKKSGKNRIARYTEGINSASGRRLDMEKNMRDAATDGYDEFEIYYQPIIDVQNGSRCAGAEALIRWNSTKLGFIPPTEFIPLAEYLGLINPIGNYVLKEACKQCHRWNESGFPDYKVNVNLSVVQLLQTDVVEIVEKTIEETGINPRNLTLEVTESLAINDMERMQEILSRIKALGVRIALDDFGTGYSSLNHIREIPFDVIKVDQSFVRELAEDAYSQSFVKMIAELAETLGVNICVEGIETEAQYNVLRGMKIKYIQGYYFDRPMKQADFEKKYLCEQQADDSSK